MHLHYKTAHLEFIIIRIRKMRFFISPIESVILIKSGIVCPENAMQSLAYNAISVFASHIQLVGAKSSLCRLSPSSPIE